MYLILRIFRAVKAFRSFSNTPKNQFHLSKKIHVSITGTSCCDAVYLHVSSLFIVIQNTNILCGQNEEFIILHQAVRAFSAGPETQGDAMKEAAVHAVWYCLHLYHR
jgi:hypothetical protein